MVIRYQNSGDITGLTESQSVQYWGSVTSARKAVVASGIPETEMAQRHRIGYDMIANEEGLRYPEGGSPFVSVFIIPEDNPDLAEQIVNRCFMVTERGGIVGIGWVKPEDIIPTGGSGLEEYEALLRYRFRPNIILEDIDN